MDHIAPASTTYPVTLMGLTTVLAMYTRNECQLSINVCVNNDAKRN